MIIVEWRGTPIYVVRHSEESLNEIDKNLDRLADPDSDTEVQPIYAKNKYRSRKPGISVLSAVCTHLGCAPKYYPQLELSILILNGKVDSFVRVMDQNLI